MKFIAKLDFFFESLNKSFSVLSGILIIYIMASVSTSVFYRYYLGIANTWVLETCEFAILYITFLSATWVLKKEGHVNMDIVVARLRMKTQDLIYSITSIFWGLLQIVWVNFNEK